MPLMNLIMKTLCVHLQFQTVLKPMPTILVTITRMELEKSLGPSCIFDRVTLYDGKKEGLCNLNPFFDRVDLSH